MCPSAIQTPTFQALNANIANDGSADSPRGFASITTTGAFTVTKGGASLYRVVVTSPAAPITATLPADVKAGYRVRFEVELTSSTETNCFFSSPAIAEAQINGTGFVELMALQDNPTLAAHWKVVDVLENGTVSLNFTGVGAGTGASNLTGKILSLVRRKNSAVVNSGAFTLTTGTGAGADIAWVGLPVRYRPVSDSYVFGFGFDGGNWFSAILNVATSGSGFIAKPSAWTSSNAGVGMSNISGTWRLA